MSISFPSSPSVDDTYTYLDQTWLWNGTAWIKSSATETGNTEGNTGEIAYYGVKGSVIKGATGFKYNDTTHGISAHGQSTFVQDLIVNEMTVGKGGGGTAGGAPLNTAFGKQCLEDLDGGLNNTAVGYQSLAGVTIGVNNTAVGSSALKQNLNNQNTAFGYRSLYINRDGSQNTSVGAQSLNSNTKGEDNTAIGFKALFNNANNPTKASEYGTQNTSLGSSAGGSIIYGENNTCLGFNAQTSSPIAHNEIVLGNSDAHIIHSAAGLSLGGGATFEGNVHLEGTGNYIQFPDGTTLGSTQTDIIGISVNNGDSVLETGKKGHRRIPYDCEVTDWLLTSTDTGVIQWDINWCTYGDWPTTASVAGTNLPGMGQLGATNKYRDGSVDWTKTTFTEGDMIEFEIDTVTTLTNCTLTLTIVRQG